MIDSWRSTPTLAGRHVTLRPLERGDRGNILEAFSAGLEGAFATIVPGPDTIERWYERIEREQAAGRAMPFAVLDRCGRVSGVTRFLRMSEPNRRVEIGGTVYAPRVQRTGLNTEAKLLLFTHAFEVLGCQCVQLRTDWLNRQSRRAIERLGAKQDGVLRGHIMIGDRLRDTVVYSILKHEWPGVHRNLEVLLGAYEEARA